MRFLVTLTLDQVTTSPAELQSAMTEFVDTELRSGTFVLTGGLAPDTDGARVELSSSGVVQVEARLPLHGFAVVDVASPAHATEVASRMLRLHQRFVPDWAGACEIRPIVTHCLP